MINPNNYETVIGIDDEVLAALVASARPFLDEPNDVLRRLLGLDNAEPASSAIVVDPALVPAVSPKRRPRARVKRARAVKGSLTREEAFEIPLLSALEQAGGALSVSDALAAVGVSMADTLNAEDHYADDKGVERWQKRVPFVRLKLVNRGLMRNDAPRGIWAISEAGRRYLEGIRTGTI